MCRHRGQPAQSKWLTGATKCNQVHISSTMIQRCNTGTARYGEYRYSQIWRIQVQWETPTVPHDSPASPPPLLVAVAQTLICPGRHYRSNMVTIIIPLLSSPQPLPSIYRPSTYRICHLFLVPRLVGFFFPSYISHPPLPPLVSYSSCSSTLVRGFRVGPTPVIRKIVGEEKKGYKKWPISWLALN